jgi:homocysteine S-methyltransferase
MSKYRSMLPHLNAGIFLTNASMNTTLSYKRNINLPYSAAFTLLFDQAGIEELERCYREYIDVAVRYGHGIILETATWRANSDWGEKLGYDRARLLAANDRSVALLVALRDEFETERSPIVINGAIGPRGDGYVAERITAAEAEDYHHAQVECFARGEADIVTAYTLTTPEEAVGIARAAAVNDMPCAISFTLETDGRLPSGWNLGEAIEHVDAATNGAPAYYMVNCTHPIHLQPGLDAGAPWMRRLRGFCANASSKSHAELDQATELDEGDPIDLGARYRALRKSIPSLSIVGGCCGTDGAHLEAICDACQ